MVTLLITLIVICAIMGVAYWLLFTVIPLPQPIRIVAMVIFGLVAIIALASLLPGGHGLRVG